MIADGNYVKMRGGRKAVIMIVLGLIEGRVRGMLNLLLSLAESFNSFLEVGLAIATTRGGLDRPCHSY
ncbi:hypothetical protein MetMK1DRAFT_00009470 [Metallosphaera yellowstonensis MK1]|uniref:Uncharacterized protein n=1 Tax=Metallosphaera yellowstonensis MK1 TaxID=671065 RepID=H2C2H4_9CREN|nr:hypothetical protein MetMK1DRAFT_00009470 [Metallosphaera yellowstonensis MK1]